SWMTSTLPWMTRSTLPTMSENPWANSAVGSTVCLDISVTIRCPPVTLALAVDIGGTKLAAALVDDSGSVLPPSRRSTPTLVTDDAGELWGALAALVDKVVDHSAYEIDVCGVGCGGPMAPDGEAVSPLNIGAWRGFPLRGRLAEHLGGELPV